MMMRVIAIATVAGLAAAASADTYGPLAVGNIPDNTPAGISSTINVGDTFEVGAVRVTLSNFSHTWSGDIFAGLSHNGTSVNFIARPGVGPGSTVGDSSNFGGNYVFEDGATDFAAILLNPANGTSFVLPSGTYGGMNSLAAFSGHNASGDWTLNVSDNAGLDLGSVGAWSLELIPVPAPSTAAFLGLAGLAAARRRRA